MGTRWAAERGVVRKENISVSNLFLSLWEHKQMEAQEERKETKQGSRIGKCGKTQEQK